MVGKYSKEKTIEQIISKGNVAKFENEFEGKPKDQDYFSKRDECYLNKIKHELVLAFNGKPYDLDNERDLQKIISGATLQEVKEIESDINHIQNNEKKEYITSIYHAIKEHIKGQAQRNPEILISKPKTISELNKKREYKQEIVKVKKAPSDLLNINSN